MKKILYKSLLYMITAVLASAVLFSCGEKDLTHEQKEELYGYYWESVADILQFTSDGRLLRNFEEKSTSDSRYTVSDGKITMYSENAPEDSMTFEFEMADGKIKIGELEYSKYQKIPDTAGQD